MDCNRWMASGDDHHDWQQTQDAGVCCQGWKVPGCICAVSWLSNMRSQGAPHVATFRTSWAIRLLRCWCSLQLHWRLLHSRQLRSMSLCAQAPFLHRVGYGHRKGAQLSRILVSRMDGCLRCSTSCLRTLPIARHNDCAMLQQAQLRCSCCCRPLGAGPSAQQACLWGVSQTIVA